MSLTIKTPITTLSGIEVKNAYGRVSVTDNYTGEKLQAELEIFFNEAAYLAGASSLLFAGLKQFTLESYDRTAMSTDILDLGHDQLISALGTQNVVAVKNL